MPEIVGMQEVFANLKQYDAPLKLAQFNCNRYNIWILCDKQVNTMEQYTIDSIRNVVMLSHSGAG